MSTRTHRLFPVEPRSWLPSPALVRLFDLVPVARNYLGQAVAILRTRLIGLRQSAQPRLFDETTFDEIGHPYARSRQPSRFDFRPGESVSRWCRRAVPEAFVVPRERREILPLYCRRVKGGRVQVRIYCPGIGSVNFGIFPGVAAAERASVKVLKHLARGKSPWEAMRVLQESGDIPTGVLPTYVYEHDGGGYGARVAKRGPGGARVVLECPGPYQLAEEAWQNMRDKLADWERATDRPVRRAA